MNNIGSSLRVQIVFWMLLPMILLIVIISAGASFVFQSQADQRINATLQREANEIGLLGESGGYESAGTLVRDYLQRSSPQQNEQLIAIVDGAVELRAGLSGIRLDQDPGFIATTIGLTEITLGTYVSDAGEFRWIAIPIKGNSDSGVLVAAVDTYSAQQQTDLALTNLAIIAFFSILLAAAFGWFASGRVFRPIAAMSDSAQAIGQHDLDQRMSEGDSDNELNRLAREFNHMLDRLQEAFDNQRQFVDDAGHELRTPLTVIRGHLDLLETDPEANSASLPIVKDELERMSRLVTDLQTLTKSNQPGFIQLSPVNLDQLNDELFVKSEALADRNWIPSSKSAAIEWSIDRQRITQAILQLADNACKQTQPGQPIEPGVEVNENFIAFYVADSGPGIPMSERKRITKRFARGIDYAEKGEGSGLGLAVVEAIAKAHGGYLRIDNSSLGGAWVGIVLPRGDK